MTLGDVLREAMRCPRCGKSTIVMATAWRGHGTGQHGAARYDATAFERISTETHCTCPGGPCDQAGLLGKKEPAG